MTGGAVDVVIPTSPEEAVTAFGDGDGITVLAGGTIVMPELTHGRLKPGKVLMLGRSGLDSVSRAGGMVTIGSAVSVAALEDGDEPLATAARHVSDPEIRGQATVGGNLCAPTSDEAPRGDLQAPLIALGAQVRSTGAGGVRTEPIEEFLEARGGRLVLDVSYEDAARTSGYAAVRRPHAHHYTILAAAATRAGDSVRVAVTGAGPTGVRCLSVENAIVSGATPGDAAASVLADVEPRDDALASAWYRSRVLPSLVARALTDL